MGLVIQRKVRPEKSPATTASSFGSKFGHRGAWDRVCKVSAASAVETAAPEPRVSPFATTSLSLCYYARLARFRLSLRRMS